MGTNIKFTSFTSSSFIVLSNYTEVKLVSLFTGTRKKYSNEDKKSFENIYRKFGKDSNKAKQYSQGNRGKIKFGQILPSLSS
jgi:hypothetical protein